MADDFTILNPGEGGDVMDETRVVYPSSPVNRKRPRVVLSGENLGEIVPAKNTALAGSEFGIITKPVFTGHPGTSITEYNITTLVASSTETTIASYTVPFGAIFYFTGFTASGNTNALYKLYVESSVILAGRSSVANLNVERNFTYAPFNVAAGDTVYLKVFHQTGVACDFEGTILGYIIS